MISKKPDFERVNSIANEILATTKCIETFPYSMIALAKEQTDVQICSYRKAREKYHLPISAFGSDSAHLEEYNGAHIIFFNECEKSYRIRFSIGHELGHIILGHKMNLSEKDSLYGVQEVETNCFTAQLVMPEQILRACNRRGYRVSVDYIKRSFLVSEEAAERRRTTLRHTIIEWKSQSERMYDDIILKRYEKFLDEIAPMKQDYYSDFEFDDFTRQKVRDVWLDERGRR